jgi:hypothetical protein
MERSILDKNNIIDLTSHQEACQYLRELERKLLDIKSRIENELVIYHTEGIPVSEYQEGYDEGISDCLKIIGELYE